jgi:hypothetical protein
MNFTCYTYKFFNLFFIATLRLKYYFVEITKEVEGRDVVLYQKVNILTLSNNLTTPYTIKMQILSNI